ncbi:hypothetical protein VM1G_06079 [Cytospora mali]|uniref:Serine/threonine-protein phosphatase 4 regulatory subunit 2 n=1 Tax=Cytospora mali TaxID=578113 RepID=A0A194W0U5_CYTMA|nr:hypothetical protein VM1G_06079 [Valsa mali]
MAATIDMEMEMEMETDDETLVKLAAGGSMDYSAWPLLLSTIVSRIEKIAHNDFPIPRIPQPVAAPAPPPPPEPRFLAPLPSSDPPDASSTPNEAGSSSTGSSQETNKENAAPAPALAPIPPTPAPAASAAVLPLEPGTLPPQIIAMIAEITGVLNESFHTYPPHTIQRLAELVLLPRQHYKSLPAYLHAVDRVVHVTSGNNIYPLPPAIPDMSPMSLSGPNGLVDQGPLPQENGVDTSLAWVSTSNGNLSVGSDEALGGALLTPIPWLQRRATGDGGSDSGESSTLGSEGGPSPLAQSQGPAPQQRSQPQAGRQFETRTESTETIDGPNGVGSIETVVISVNGLPSIGAGQQQRVITQGELIRQEQRAGVVPVSQLQRSGPLVVTSSSTAPSGTPPAAGGPSAAATETDTKMEDGEAPKDASGERPDEEMADEEEGPHARGPDIIGAADMGPQNPTSSTFSISSGGNVEMRGIDVEAAVGRKAEVPPTTADTSSDDEPAVLTPLSSEDTVGQGQDSKAEKEGETKPDEARSSEDADATLSSATLSGRVSPTPSKRGAEDDGDAESVSSKRFKGPDGEDEATGDTTTAELPKFEEDKGDGDVVLSDQVAQGPSGAADTEASADGQEEGKDKAKPDDSTT